MNVLAAAQLPFTAASCLIGPARGAAQLARYRDRRVRALVAHAAACIPHYRALWQRTGTCWQALRGTADLAALPVTTKAMLRRLSPDDVVDGRLDRATLLHHATSGSTGIPTHIWRTHAEERRLNLFRWRTLVRFGLRPGDRLAVVKLTTGGMPRGFDILQRVMRGVGVVDRRAFDCFLPPEALQARLEAFRPQVLSGFARSLVRLARSVPASASASASGWAPRVVVTGGEGISLAERELLRQRFDAPVHDIYGTTECNVMAFSCAETGAYHVCDDSVIVEVCRDGVPVAPGETGEVVVTSLHSWAMPLIRVAVGDRAIAGDDHCACGSRFSTLQGIEGRVVDPFTVAGGRVVHPFELTNQVLEAAAAWMAEFQIEQEREDAFRVRVVGKHPVGTEALADLGRSLQRVLPASVRVEVELASALARDPSGKLHYCRSLPATDAP
ncbi:MAG: AMP-binding protein [Casimicrobiaceae bacterium]